MDIMVCQPKRLNNIFSKMDLNLLVENALSDINWNLHSDIHVFTEKRERYFDAFVGSRWKVTARFDPNLEEITNTVLDKKKLQHIYPDPCYSVVRGILKHEIGHWRDCPKDWYHFEDILAGCSDAISSTGISVNPNQYFSSLKNFLFLFEDLIVNVVNANYRKGCEDYTKDFALLRLLDNSIAEERPNQSIAHSKYVTLVSEIEEALFLDIPELRKKLKKGKINEEMNLTLKKVYHALLDGDENLVEKTIKGKLEKEDYRKIGKIVRRPNNWYHKAATYTRELLPYFNEASKDEMENSMGTGSYFSEILFGKNPEEDNGENANPENGSSDNHEGIETDEGDEKEDMGDEKEILSEDSNREAIQPKESGEEDVYKKVNKQILDEIIRISSKKSRRKITYAKNYDILDSLYQKRAEEIIISLLDKDKDGLNMRIADLSREIATPENIDVRRVKWSGSRLYKVNGKNHLALYQGDLPITTDDPLMTNSKDIPDVAMIVDSSGSMEANLFEGDGPYDMLLRANYSLLNWIERTGKAYHMNFAVVNYSNSTYYSGWQDYRNLDEVKKHLLYFQNHLTHIDSEKLDQMNREKNSNFLAILTTDGGFQNPEPVIESLQYMVKDGNALSIIYVNHKKQGENSRYFFNEMETYAEVHEIENPEDLIGINIGYGIKYWGEAK